MKTIKLNNGFEIPMEGFGVFQVPNHDECRKAVHSKQEDDRLSRCDGSSDFFRCFYFPVF